MTGYINVIESVDYAMIIMLNVEKTQQKAK